MGKGTRRSVLRVSPGKGLWISSVYPLTHRRAFSALCCFSTLPQSWHSPQLRAVRHTGDVLGLCQSWQVVGRCSWDTKLWWHQLKPLPAAKRVQGCLVPSPWPPQGLFQPCRPCPCSVCKLDSPPEELGDGSHFTVLTQGWGAPQALLPLHCLHRETRRQNTWLRPSMLFSKASAKWDSYQALQALLDQGLYHMFGKLREAHPEQRTWPFPSVCSPPPACPCILFSARAIPQQRYSA